MHSFTLLLSVIFAIFSTAVMSYISMAMPIGPWIAPTIVLLAMFIVRLVRQNINNQQIAFITAAGSVGGILATGFAFSLPTLYFLDKALFASWLAQPGYFTLVLTGLALSAGAFGIWIADFFEHKLIEQDQLAFPIGQLVYKMIAVHNQVRKMYELIIGFILTLLFTILQDGIYTCRALIPKTITLLPAMQWQLWRIPIINLDLWPMLWAIGFITGHVIAIPLAVGAIARVAFIDPLNQWCFATLSNMEFVLAFCSGMVLYGVLMSFSTLPKTLAAWYTKKHTEIFYDRLNLLKNNTYSFWRVAELASILGGISFFLYCFCFSILSQAYLLIATFVFTYQIAVIAGKIGIAPLGRFATFVMVPAMLLFSLDNIQIVFIATFVEVCGGVTADILFNRKLGQLMGLDHALLKRYQYLGLLISAATVGIIFWLLITYFELGSPQLFAYKAQSRQLLIHAQHFNWYVLIIGACFSFLLSYTKVNAMLVLGGLLMPLNMSLGLIAGGMLTLLVKSREDWEPFWSGVYASNSLWMLIRAMIG